jgi:hypothetical protein
MTHLPEHEIARIRLAVQFRTERKEEDKILYAAHVPSMWTGVTPIDMHHWNTDFDIVRQKHRSSFDPDTSISHHWRGIHQVFSILEDLDEILPKELIHIIKEYVDTKRKIYNDDTTLRGAEQGCVICSFVEGIWRDAMKELKYGLVSCVPAGQNPTTYLKKRFRLR